MALWLSLPCQALILTVLCIAVRDRGRGEARPPLAIIAVLCYGAAALPWFRLYLNTVILHGGA